MKSFFAFNKINLLVGLVFAFLTVVVLAQSQGLPNFTALVEKNQAAVVNISAVQKVSRRGDPFGGYLEDYFRHFGPPVPDNRPKRPPTEQRQSLGSGFLVSSDGYILTNAHVIEDASEIFVRLSDRREFLAEIVGTDSRSDIALLKIDASGLPIVRIGRSENVQVGEWVLAIGSPFGFDHSVTSGIVSALHRSLPTENNENYVPFIQTDVAINPGNSGGPLFNLDGEVIGINSQIYTRTGSYIGVSFAIPIDVAMEVTEQLKSDGVVSRGWLGVTIQEVSVGLAESFGLDKPMGALISQVVKDSPADKGGIQGGDIIIAIDGRSIDLSGELPHVVGRIKPDTRVAVDVIRDKKKVRLHVRLGKLPSRSDSAAGSSQLAGDLDASLEGLGMRVSEVPADARKRLQNRGFSSGVLVTGIRDGPAGRAGILQDDFLVSIDNKAIESVAQFKDLVASLQPGSKVPVHVVRRNSLLFVALSVPAER